MTGLSDHSLGIAQTIVLRYFPQFMENHSNVIQYYGSQSVLHWGGVDYTGTMEIETFLKGLPESTIQVGGFEVQTVPNTTLWTMLIVFGTMNMNHSTRDFHSTFYIESNEDANKALIRYHTFDFV